VSYLKLIWIDGDLRFLTRNTIIDVLIRKHDKREIFWTWLENKLRFRRQSK